MIQIEDFLSRLEGVTSDGHDGWMAICPAHPDKNPSLHINLGTDGRILLNCFSHCTAEEIVSAMGLKLKDLMPDNGKGKRGKSAVASRTSRGASEKSKGKDAKAKDGKRQGPSVKPLSAYRAKRRPTKHICYYDYKDETGAIVYRVDRRVYTDAEGGKTFIQQHPDPSQPGGWGYGVSKAGVQYVPFRLPRILAAAKAGKNVIILEGEKDVISVERHLGVVATCNARGAGKWDPGFGKWFKGVPKVLIVADKDPLEKVDEKTGETKLHAVGQRHACDVEAKLRADGYEGEIRKVVLPDVEIEQGVTKRVKDFTDWAEAIEAAGRKVSKAEFAKALEQAGEWPKEYEFEGSALADLQRAQKEARGSASSSAPAPGEEAGSEKEVRNDGRDEMGSCGRYGRLSPRSPLEGARLYEVDFQIRNGMVARFEVGVGGLKFEGWRKSEASEDFGKFKKDKDFTRMEGPLNLMVGMAVGCLSAWDRNFKMTNPQRYELISSLTLAWLRARGKFFADFNNPNYETSLFFDGVEGILYRLHSNEFFSFVATESNINREDKAFKFVMSLVDDMAMSKETPRVVPSKEWDRKGDAIYISNGDSRMCKITAGKIEDVANGTDGVVFVRGSTLEPWKLKDGPGVDPFVHSMLFQNAALEKESDRMNCRLWFLNLFACHTNKPILLVTGPARSGKTRLIQGMKQFLGIREDGNLDDTVTDIDPTDKGLDAFWVIIDRGRFEIFDNYDSKIKWAENALQTAATNGSSKRRELYKTQVLVTLRANAYIALTSNNPIFTTEGGGLPDRIITARIGSGRKVSIGGELFKSIMDNRDDYMTWLARVLCAVLADEKPVDESINKRHPDYGAFAVKCGRAIGNEQGAILAMGAAEMDKALLPLMNDIITKEIVAVLVMQPKIANMSFTATEMADMIIKRLGDDESDDKTKTIYGARRIGKAIAKLSREFSTLFCWSARMLEGRTRYEFTGLTAQGDAVADVLRGGLVGLNGENPKSLLGSESADGFSQNGTSNPPIPPYARAQVHTSFSTNKEDDDIESEDLGDVDF